MGICELNISATVLSLTWGSLYSWWRHQMETFSALLAIYAGNSSVSGEFPAQRPVTQSFDVYFDLRPDNRLSKQSLGWWFETLSHSLWCHRNVVRWHLILRPPPGSYGLHPAITKHNKVKTIYIILFRYAVNDRHINLSRCEVHFVQFQVLSCSFIMLVSNSWID